MEKNIVVRLVVLILTLTLSLTAFSQVDTNKPVKCFSIPTTKRIVKDLLSGDSAKVQLELTNQQLVETEKKVVKKDTIISLMKVKEDNYITIIDSQNQKYSILNDHTKKLEWNLKKEKVKNKFTSILSSGVIVVLTILLIIK